MIYLLTAIGLSPGGSSTAQIYTQDLPNLEDEGATFHRNVRTY